jgi:taurine transport system permease protein
MGERELRSAAVNAAGLPAAELPRVARLPKPAREGRRTITRNAALPISAASVGMFVLAWYFVTSYGYVSPVFLPSPQMVWRAAARLAASGDLLDDVIVSSERVLLGFGFAALIGIPLGVIMGVWWPAKSVLDPFISLLRPLPSITWIPLTILWLGIGEPQKVAIVFLGSWIYVLIATFESTRRVDPLLIRAARNLGASDTAVMREVVLPGALPGIITGLKITLAISWSCVLSAEMVAAQNGLGALIWQAKDWGNLALVLVGMVCISITVLIADFAARRIEALLLPWERHRRS